MYRNGTASRVFAFSVSTCYGVPLCHSIWGREEVRIEVHVQLFTQVILEIPSHGYGWMKKMTGVMDGNLKNLIMGFFVCFLYVLKCHSLTCSTFGVFSKVYIICLRFGRRGNDRVFDYWTSSLIIIKHFYNY